MITHEDQIELIRILDSWIAESPGYLLGSLETVRDAAWNYLFEGE